MNRIDLRLVLGFAVLSGFFAGTPAAAQEQSNYEPYLFTTLAGLSSNAGFYFPAGVAIDSAGNSYVADTANCTIRKITPAGAVSTVAGLAGSVGSADGTAGTARFAFPQGVAIDGAGNIYVADTFNNTIRKITPAGVVSTVAGLAGNPGFADGASGTARFNNPAGLAVNSAGNVYVADAGNSTIRKITPAGVVSTLAGLAGSPDFADGAGNSARFNFPSGVAVDGAGNVYVADTDNDIIRKITAAGDVSTLAGLAANAGSTDGTGSAARFSGPEGVALDSAGNVYVADTRNFTIRKITPAGEVTTLTGLPGNSGDADGTGSAARFNGPSGVAVDSNGNVSVADAGNNTIRKINLAGEVKTLAGLAGSPGAADGIVNPARLSFPSDLTTDSAGNLYVSDFGTNTIRKITSAGIVTTFAGLPGNTGSADGTGSDARFNNPSGMGSDSAGNIYVADTNNHTVRKITPAGVVTTLAGLAGNMGSADGTGSTARFNHPSSVALDSSGNVYVADTNNSTIRKITPAGVVTTLAGSAGNAAYVDGAGSAARFNFPSGAAVDNTGNVYVADTGNSLIRKITPAGLVTLLAGTPPFCNFLICPGGAGSADGKGAAAQFNNPYALTVDSAGNVYVADGGNSTIRKITSKAVVTTFAGLAGNIGSADGTGSAARFYVPSGITRDQAGNLYVADARNNNIRKITSSGVVSTLAGLASSGSADGTGSAARFFFPFDVAVDGAGNVYVADTDNQTIRKIAPGRVVTTFAGLAGSQGTSDGTGSAARFAFPQGVAVDSVGNLYISDSSTIRKITTSGNVTTLAVDFFPQGAAVDSAGNIYVAVTIGNQIHKLTPSGDLSVFAGSPFDEPGSADGLGENARFDHPWGVAVDNLDNVYVPDAFNNTIRKITPAGEVTTFAGLAGSVGSADGIGSAARFNGPAGVAVDSAGNVYVSDALNRTIRKITPAGVVTTLGGLTNAFDSADGRGSAARFSLPQGLAVDSAGNVYVADSFNNTIRIGAPPPFITSPLFATSSVGRPFVYQIEAEGATSLSASNLPPGLVLVPGDPTLGVIGGTPTQAGIFQITLTASNAQHTTTATLIITVQNASGPIIASGTCVKGRTGQPFSFKVLTLGASATARVIASGLPPGLTIDPVSGLISGIPTANGSFLVTLTVSDRSVTNTSTLQLTFTSDSAVPVITNSISGDSFGSVDAPLVPGQFFSYTITTPGVTPTSFDLIGTLPTGLHFDSATGTISGTFMSGAQARSPKTIRIVRPLVCNTIAHNAEGTGVSSINFLVPATITFSFDPPDIAVEAAGPNGAAAVFTVPTAKDANGVDVPVVCDAPSGATFPVGTTLVTCSATDSSGNTDIAFFNIIVQDTTSPVISVPPNITVKKQKKKVNGKIGAIVSFNPAPTATDIVDGTVMPTANPASGSFFSLGTTTVVVTAVDSHGNQAVPKSFTVNVVNKIKKK